MESRLNRAGRLALYYMRLLTEDDRPIGPLTLDDLEGKGWRKYCTRCKRPYMGKRSTAKYCSNSCRIKQFRGL